MFTAKANLPLPKIPHFFKEQIKKLASEGQVTLYKKSGNGIFECRHLTNELYAWLKVNVVGEGYDVTKIVVQTIRDGNFEPHIDGPSVTGLIRHYNLMYIIETGGDLVTTQFYDSPESLISKAAASDYRIQYEEATVIDAIEFKKDTWNLMNNQLFHSVEGITNTRIGLSISFYDAQMPKFLLDLLAKIH